MPVARGYLVSGTAGALLTAPSALRVVGTTAYVTANGGTRAVQVVDVSNPLAPTPKGQLVDGSGGANLNGPTGIAVSGNYAYVSASWNNALQILRITSGGGFQVKGATVLATNAANDVLIGSGLPAAKVAIGTSNATARLTVAGSDTAATSAAANFTDSTGQSLLLIQNDGKVGIGTSTPTAKLDIVGDVKVSGTLTVGGQAVVTATQLAPYATTTQVTTQLVPYQLANGSGAGLTALDASQLTTGTLPAARIANASLPLAALASNPLARANHTGTQAWSTLTAKPTTVSGYGITDAVTKTAVGDVSVTGTLTVGGQSVVTANQLGSYSTTAQVTAQLVPYQLANGSGAGLTALDASQLTTGTLPPARVANASLPLAALASNPLARSNHTGTQAWSTLTATPTTVSGYGITDAVQKNATGDVAVTGTTTLQGNVVINAPSVTVKNVLRLPPSGDVSMGTFTNGTNPSL